jgi:glycosyltransferase 2 family protein
LDKTPLDNQAREKQKGRINWQLVVSILVSLVFLILAIKGVDFGQAWAAVKTMDPLLTVFAITVSIATLLAKAARWQVIYAPRRKLSFHRSFSILMIGLWANAFLPLRVGEILRAFLLGEVEQESKTYALGTIFLEKVADLVMLATALAILLTQLVIPKWVWESWVSTFLVVGALLAAVWALVIYRQPILNLLKIILSKLIPRWQNKIITIINEGMNSLQMLKEPKQVAAITIWTIIIWFLSVYNFSVLFKAFDLDLTFWVAMFIVIVLQLGVAIPSSPGKIGVFHYLVIIGLSIFGIPKDVALTVGVVSHLMIYAPIALLGLFYLWHENLAWRSISQAASRLDWTNSK